MTNLPHTQAALKRRKQLADALLELMRTKGYAQTTVADICREASIPRRTFYPLNEQIQKIDKIPL